jgi:hypothetical protein
MDRVALSEPRRIAEVGMFMLIWYMPLFAVITVILFDKIIARAFAHSPNLSAVRITVASVAVLESESNSISKLVAGIHTTPCCSSIVILAKL